VYFSKIYNFKGLSLIINLLQLVTWFPKMAFEGGAWKISNVKGGLNQKSLGAPGLYYYCYKIIIGKEKPK
jgi:hypothetical protein